MDQVEDRNLFKSGIAIALEEWDTLQACLDHGMGGEYANDKVEWMTDVLRKYFIDTRNSFDYDDAIDYVEEIMDKEFDTVIEDGSTEILIRKLMKFFTLNNEGRYDELRNALNEKLVKLNETADVRKRKRQETKMTEDLMELDMESGSDSESDDNLNDDSKRDNRAVTDEDGWTKF